MEDNYYLYVKSIRNYLSNFGKDISHLSDEEVKSKAETVSKKVKELNININTQGDKYLEITFDVFNV